MSDQLQIDVGEMLGDEGVADLIPFIEGAKQSGHLPTDDENLTKLVEIIQSPNPWWEMVKR